MIVSAYLIAWTLAACQAPQPPALPWGPRLSCRQELVFRGSFIEETSRAKTSVTRLYEAEIRVLVLETLPTGAHVALLTTTNPQVKTLKTRENP